MNKVTKIILALVAVIVIAAGVMLAMGQKTDEKTMDEHTMDKKTTKSVTVMYDANGFSPAEVNVAAGTKITFVNNSAAEIEPASDPHPVHTDNPELNAGDIEPGGKKSVMPMKKGTWGMHNHYHPAHHATVVVK